MAITPEAPPAHAGPMDKDDLDFTAFHAWAAAVAAFQRGAHERVCGDELGALRDRVAWARSRYEIASEAQSRIQGLVSDWPA